MRLIDAAEAEKIISKRSDELLDAGEHVVSGTLMGAIGLLVKTPTIDPIHAAGGCYCRECRFIGDPEECPLLYFNQRELDEHDTSDTDFCSYGELREAQDDG